MKYDGLNLVIDQQTYVEELVRTKYPNVKINDVIPISRYFSENWSNNILIYGYFRGEFQVNNVFYYDGLLALLSTEEIFVSTQIYVTGFQISIENSTNDLNGVPVPIGDIRHEYELLSAFFNYEDYYFVFRNLYNSEMIEPLVLETPYKSLVEFSIEIWKPVT